ncbi:hypothetical protein ACRASX_13785 [Flavobacterium sp. TMP13]|uniref:hypothetical protein n=1 Tax=unclassified Flavobacterium TaxID=196869 RepID=UPI00076C339C|nr:hypothetical protein [Flavobacterium sp. TAB 87]KVV16304.1 hypothetical protein AP058_00134 [Flavobacterium sp. TAB 87]
MSILQNHNSESPVAKKIQEQTAKLSSDLFLWDAFASMAGSATLKVMGKGKTALFFGQWATSFLLLEVYNKIVKVEGIDSKNKRGN